MKDKTHHIFRFLIDKECKELLRRKAERYTGGNISELVVRILKESHATNKKEKGTQNKEEHYCFIHQDKRIPRETLQVSLPMDLYQGLKTMSRTLEFYSLAQLVRGYIRKSL